MLTLLGGVVFAIKLYRVGITVKEAKGIAKTVTTQPLSCFRSILRRSPQNQAAETGPTSQDSPSDIGTRASLREDLDLHPIRMRGHPADSPTRRENRPSSMGNTWTGKPDGKDRESTVAPHPKYWSWRRLELPAETPVRKAVTNSQASCQVHKRCNRI